MSSSRRLVAIGAAFLVAATGLASAGCDGETTGSATGVRFEALSGEELTGAADLAQSGARVSGTISIVGLEPGSAHAAHVHGVAGEDHGCAEEERTSEHLVELPDVVADDDGVVEVEIDVTAPEGSIREGTYLMIHAQPDAHSARGTAHHAGHGDSSAREATMTSSAYARVNGAASSTPENPPIACAEFEDG